MIFIHDEIISINQFLDGSRWLILMPSVSTRMYLSVMSHNLWLFIVWFRRTSRYFPMLTNEFFSSIDNHPSMFFSEQKIFDPDEPYDVKRRLILKMFNKRALLYLCILSVTVNIIRSVLFWLSLCPGTLHQTALKWHFKKGPIRNWESSAVLRTDKS